jgi:hypothetical protein
MIQNMTHLQQEESKPKKHDRKPHAKENLHNIHTKIAEQKNTLTNHVPIVRHMGMM